MAPAIWLWAKRAIGSLCMLGTIVASGALLFVVLQRHAFAELNRAHEQPLPVDPKNRVLTSAHRLLKVFPAPPSKDSLQFVVMPSFGQRWFAVSLAQTSTQGVGKANVLSPDGNLTSRYAFVVPTKDLAGFLARWDALSDGYPGEGRLLADGNPLAFERRRGDRITSGVGNSPCHYDALGDLAAQSLSAFVPELRDLRNVQHTIVMQSDFCQRSIMRFL